MEKRLKIVILTGAGISAESGIKTFRDADGLWEGHDVMSVASPSGWEANPSLVLDFYNQRRRQLLDVEPNIAHTSITELEKDHDVVVITQNVDNLHERAGNSNVIHLHGRLDQMRSVLNEEVVFDKVDDINLGDLAGDGGQLRPHIVWFGEAVPMIDKAIEEMLEADLVIIVGTSMQVYPAAGLVGYARKASQIFYIDPKPHISAELTRLPNLRVIETSATVGLPHVVEKLRSL